MALLENEVVLARGVEPAGPAGPAESFEPAGPVEPAESFEPAGPVEPAESLEPAGPARRVESADVVIVGGGVVGCAIARELSGYAVAGRPLSVVLVEARQDVGDGTSKANTAILRTGFDATPGTLEARLVRRGYELLSAYAADAGIPVERTGATVVAWTQEEFDALPGLLATARRNDYRDAGIVDAAEVYRQLPDSPA